MTSKSPVGDISVVTLIRTDTTSSCRPLSSSASSSLLVVPVVFGRVVVVVRHAVLRKEVLLVQLGVVVSAPTRLGRGFLSDSSGFLFGFSLWACARVVVLCVVVVVVVVVVVCSGISGSSRCCPPRRCSGPSWSVGSRSDRSLGTPSGGGGCSRSSRSSWCSSSSSFGLVVLLARLLDVDVVLLGLQVVVGVGLLIVQVVVWVNLAPLSPVPVVVPSWSGVAVVCATPVDVNGVVVVRPRS